MTDDPQRQKAEARAYRLLARRSHGEAELRRKLLAGGFDEKTVTAVLDKCRDLGYLDDARFARQRAGALAMNRLAGDRRIAADLRERGIDEALIREAIDGVRREMGEAEALSRFWARRLKGLDPAALDDRQKARLVRGALGRGFSLDLVYRTLKRGSGIDGDDGQ